SLRLRTGALPVRQHFRTHIAYLLQTHNNFSLLASKFRGSNPTVDTVSPWGHFAWWFVVLLLSPFASSYRRQRRLAPLLTPTLRPRLRMRRYRPTGECRPTRPQPSTLLTGGPWRWEQGMKCRCPSRR